MIAYHRTALAQQLVQALQGKAPLGEAHNGLFLAAPRRTGKSTFLQGDLRHRFNTKFFRCELNKCVEHWAKFFMVKLTDIGIFFDCFLWCFILNLFQCNRFWCRS